GRINARRGPRRTSARRASNSVPCKTMADGHPPGSGRFRTLAQLPGRVRVPLQPPPLTKQRDAVLPGPGACCHAWTGTLPGPCYEPEPKGCSSQAAETTRTSAQLGTTFAEPPLEANP